MTVEDDYVVIDNVSLHTVPKLQVEIADLWVVAKVNPISIVSDDVLGSRVVVGPVVHKLLHPGGGGRGGGGGGGAIGTGTRSVGRTVRTQTLLAGEADLSMLKGVTISG